MSATAFDAVAHHRARSRRAEARADALELQRTKLERLLGRALQIAAGSECEPLVLLAVLEEIDRLAAKPAPTIEELVVVLRETDPDPSWRTP